MSAKKSKGAWVYQNDSAGPVKVRIKGRAIVLQSGQTLHVPEGVAAVATAGGVTRLEHQRPRARYFTADHLGGLREHASDPGGIRIGDDVAPVVEKPVDDDTPDATGDRFDDQPAAEYVPTDDTSEAT